MIILFPNNQKIWRAEIIAAQAAGFSPVFFEWAELFKGNMSACLRQVPAFENVTSGLVRCGSLEPFLFNRLSDALEMRGIRLVNDVLGYVGGILPCTMRKIAELMPKAMFLPDDCEDTAAQQKIVDHFGSGKLMLKGAWRSAKYHRARPWDIEDADDPNEVNEAIKRLRAYGVQGGLLVSRFEELHQVSPYTLPFTEQRLYEEHRMFFFRGQLAAMGNYFEELPDYMHLVTEEEIDQVCQVATNITTSDFFVLDVARKANGQLIAIETNPGEASGFAIRYAPKLYQGIKKILDTTT